MRKPIIISAGLCLLMLSGIAQADVFNLGAGFTSLETVTVGDPGNAGESSGSGKGRRICGSVAYSYNIGKYEVTAKQYTDFLNAKANVSDPYQLYSSEMWNSTYGCKIQRTGAAGSYTYSVASEFANRPVNYVSYWDSMRFANWLGNGQGSGSTENGAYTIPDGYTGTDGRTIQRNAGATWCVTSEDEWYKAAYYKGGGTNAGYWLYPTGSNGTPGQDLQDLTGNNTNHSGALFPIDAGKYTTVVGEFQNSESPYGTFDQGGNVWEWNESVIYQSVDYAYRGIRGGSFFDVDFTNQAVCRIDTYPSKENSDVGFRVSAVPEPMSVLLAAGGLMTIIGLRRRKA